MKEKTLLRIYGILLIPLSIIWLRSSIGKLTEGTFVENLNQTFARFAENNPYPWYKNLITTIAIPNFETIGAIVMWTEFVVALITLFCAIILLFRPIVQKPVLATLSIGLILGIILNVNFYFASGWTSPSSESLNFLMIAFQIILLWITYSLIKKR